MEPFSSQLQCHPLRKINKHKLKYKQIINLNIRIYTNGGFAYAGISGSSGSAYARFVSNGWTLESDGCAPTPAPTPTPPPTPPPTPLPTPIPTPKPTPLPTPIPTPVPTPRPTPIPTPQPTPIPTPQPTAQPTPQFTPVPTPIPTPVPTFTVDAQISSETSNTTTVTSLIVVFVVLFVCCFICIIVAVIVIRRRKQQRGQTTKDAVFSLLSRSTRRGTVEPIEINLKSSESTEYKSFPTQSEKLNNANKNNYETNNVPTNKQFKPSAPYYGDTSQAIKTAQTMNTNQYASADMVMAQRGNNTKSNLSSEKRFEYMNSSLITGVPNYASSTQGKERKQSNKKKK